MLLAETNAALAATAKLDHADGSVREVLSGYGIALEAVAEWADPGAAGLLVLLGLDAALMPDELRDAYTGRFVGSIAAAIILGIELQRNQEVT